MLKSRITLLNWASGQAIMIGHGLVIMLQDDFPKYRILKGHIYQLN